MHTHFLFLLFFGIYFWWAIWQINTFSSCCWIIRDKEDWNKLKDLLIQKRTIISTQLSASLCFQARTHLSSYSFGSKKTTVFIKLNISSLYIKPHSFVTNEYNKHQCIANLGLKSQIPKLFLLVAEHWKWDVSLDAMEIRNDLSLLIFIHWNCCLTE